MSMNPYEPLNDSQLDQMESLERKAEQTREAGPIESFLVLAFLSGFIVGAWELIQFFVARVGK
jgi:hypothetical protein